MAECLLFLSNKRSAFAPESEESWRSDLPIIENFLRSYLLRCTSCRPQNEIDGLLVFPIWLDRRFALQVANRSFSAEDRVILDKIGQDLRPRLFVMECQFSYETVVVLKAESPSIWA